MRYVEERRVEDRQAYRARVWRIIVLMVALEILLGGVLIRAVWLAVS